MKRLISIFLLLLSIAYSSTAQRQVLDLINGSFSPFTTEIKSPERIVTATEDYVEVTYTFLNAATTPDDLRPHTRHISIPGFYEIEESAKPAVLYAYDRIRIPKGKTASIELINCEYKAYNFELTPARHPLVASPSEQYTIENVSDITVYQGSYPNTYATIEDIQQYRDTKYANIRINPTTYDYISKRVNICTNITYRVNFAPGQTNSPNFQEEEETVDPIMNNIVVNPVIRNKTRANSSTVSIVEDFILLTTPEFEKATLDFAQWKKIMGYQVHVLCKADWTPQCIKDTLYNMYQSLDNLKYVLIVGNHKIIPSEISHYGSFEYVTDHNYVCFNSANQIIPDVYIGRILADEVTEAITTFNKIKLYEYDPPTLTSFYKTGIHVSSFQPKGKDKLEYEHYGYDFITEAEKIRDHMISNQYDITRVYSIDLNSINRDNVKIYPQDVNPTYFSNGNTLPTDIRRPNYPWNASGTSINSAIEEGGFYLFYTAHGARDSLYSVKHTKKHISVLNNGQLQPFFFSISCNTGDHYKTEDKCYAQMMMAKPNGGAVGMIAATDESFVSNNHRMANALFNSIWPEPSISGVPNVTTPAYRIGEMLYQSLLLANNTGYHAKVYGCFTDPSLELYTENPVSVKNLVTSTYDQKYGILKVTAPSQSYISLYNTITGETKCFYGNNVSYTTLYPDDIFVTVRNHNQRIVVIYPNSAANKLYLQNTFMSTGLSFGSFDKSIEIGSNVNATQENGPVRFDAGSSQIKGASIYFTPDFYISSDADVTIRTK